MQRRSENKQLRGNEGSGLGKTQNQEHETVVDWHTKKKLKRAEYGINRNNKFIYIIFFLEFVVFALIIIAWTTLGLTESFNEVLISDIKNETLMVNENIDAIRTTSEKIKELERKLASFKEENREKVQNYTNRIDEVKNETAYVRTKIEDTTQKIERFKNTLDEAAKCGYTKKMSKDFDVSNTPHARMQCANKECHCYGTICLVSDGKGNCSAGNVFVNGRAICAKNDGFTSEFGRIICRELGFRDLVRISDIKEFGYVSNKLARGHAVGGWISLSNKSSHAFQHFCNTEKNFADCFEKFKITNGVKREEGISGFYEVYGNYYEVKQNNGTIITKYEEIDNCGSTESAPNFEQANGVVCL